MRFFVVTPHIRLPLKILFNDIRGARWARKSFGTGTVKPQLVGRHGGSVRGYVGYAWTVKDEVSIKLMTVPRIIEELEEAGANRVSFSFDL